MKARVIIFENGKKRIGNEFTSVKDATRNANNSKKSYNIKERVERGLGWSVEKKTSKGWKPLSWII